MDHHIGGKWDLHQNTRGGTNYKACNLSCIHLQSPAEVQSSYSVTVKFCIRNVEATFANTDRLISNHNDVIWGSLTRISVWINNYIRRFL